MAKEKRNLTRVELLRLKKNAENLYNYGFLKTRDYNDIVEDINDWLLIKE
tara:strand:- start:397 stop:546 length:150 start_codon:yes stop_codon:yes gene_type:complete